jgi:hypothetical protein
MQTPLLQLKERLLKLGSLRPIAWQALQEQIQKTTLKANESFTRSPGQIAYVVDGILKEYDAHMRKRPAIINFLGTDEFILTHQFSQRHYLKACIDTQILSIHREHVLSLQTRFPELLRLYIPISISYYESSFNRQYLLEIKSVPERIARFKERFHTHLKYLRLKDVANYLNINYDYLSIHYRN